MTVAPTRHPVMARMVVGGTVIATVRAPRTAYTRRTWRRGGRKAP